MSDSSQSQLFFVKESVFNTTPASALQTLRSTGESLARAIENIVSNEIRQDRQIPDLILTSGQSGGGLDFELSYTTYDDLFAGALYTDWVGVGGGSTELLTSGASASNLEFTLASAGNTITFGSAVTHAIVPGQWIELAGSTADDGYHQVTAVSGQELTVRSSPGIATDETLDETDSATVKGGRIRNGTTRASFSMEKLFADKTKYMSFTGMVVNNLSLNLASRAITTGSLQFLGVSHATAGSTIGTGGPTAATTTDVMSASSNVAQISEGGTIYTTTFVNSMTINLTNNLRPNAAVGSSEIFNIGSGRCNVTGTMSIYFEDFTEYDKFIAGTPTEVDVVFEDDAGNGLIFSLPHVKFTTGEILARGTDQDVFAELGYQAVLDPIYGHTIEMTRVAA